MQARYEAWLPPDLRHELPELDALQRMFAGADAAFLARDEVHAATGCIVLCEDGEATGQIRRLFVDPAHRGKGVAKALVLHTIAYGRACGYRRLTLETAYDRLKPALDLYESLGFKRVQPARTPPLYYDLVFLDLFLR